MSEQLYLLINGSWPGDEKYRVTSRPENFRNPIPIVEKHKLDSLRQIANEVIAEFQWVTNGIQMNEEQHIRLGNAIAKLHDVANIDQPKAEGEGS